MKGILHKLIESLRNELQQYGEMLALLDQQQEAVRLHGAGETLRWVWAVHAQSLVLQAALEQRQLYQAELARALQEAPEAAFSRLVPLLPEPYRPLVSALVQENAALLERVCRRARQNQALLHRSVELMEQLLTTLTPDPAGRSASDQEPCAVPIHSAPVLPQAMV